MFEMKFKVGDKIIGKEHNGYSITDQYATMVVTDVFSWGDMRVEVIKHKNLPGRVGFRYFVINNSAYFRKVGATFI